MKTFIAGVERSWHWKQVKDIGMPNILCSFAAESNAKIRLEEVVCYSIVDVPDAVGEAFLATGLPHTCEALKKWLKERNV